MNKQIQLGYLLDFQKALFNNSLIDMNIELNRLLQGSISFFDTVENFYHGFMVGIFVNTMNNYYINSNKESGGGRYDMTIESKDGKTVYIFEFKIVPEKDIDNFEEYANIAINQINSKNYDEEYLKRNFENIYKYGVAFNKKNALIIDK